MPRDCNNGKSFLSKLMEGASKHIFFEGSHLMDVSLLLFTTASACITVTVAMIMLIGRRCSGEI